MMESGWYLMLCLSRALKSQNMYIGGVQGGIFLLLDVLKLGIW